MTSVRLDVRLPIGPSAPAVARHALEGMDLYVGQENHETIKLLVSELVTNSVRHGRPDPTKGIVLRVTSTHEHVHVEVIDHGAGFDGSKPAVQPESPAIGGWGLYLTDRLAADWGVERDDATCVWFDVPLTGDRAGRALGDASRPSRPTRAGRA